MRVAACGLGDESVLPVGEVLEESWCTGVDRAPRGWVASGAEFVLVPAQPVDDAGPLGHGLVAVVDRQPDLVAGAVQVREGKILH